VAAFYFAGVVMRPIVFFPILLCWGAFSAAASVDSGLLSLVPAGAKIIGSVDVTRARDSDFGQYLLSKAQNEDANFQEMIEQTGFDPRRDLQSIIFASDGPGTAGKHSSFAILARGNFDTARIEALAANKGATIVKYQNVDLIVQPKKNGEQTAIGFPEVGVAAMADLATLKGIIDNLAAPTVLDPDMAKTINGLGNSNDAWYVSLVGGSFLAGHMGNEAGAQSRALQGVIASSGGVKLGATIATTFDAVTRSPQDATSLSDVIRFMASMVQMQRQNDPKAGILASALDGMTLENSGSAVHVAVSMPEKSLEELAEAGRHGSGR
jgi:hypothetical protein